MFDFLKKTKTVEPIFESLEVDMHNHLVPCVDDGSRSAEETLLCLEAMRRVGFKKTYITPHFQFPRYPNTEDDIQQRFNTLKNDLKSTGNEIELLGVGGEYRIDDGFVQRMETCKFLQVGNEEKYLLVELSLHQPRLGIEELIFDLQMKGYEVILAHPERYPYLTVRSGRVAKLKEQGVSFQCNLLSFSGFYGSTAQRNAFEYVESGMVEFLGSDSHNRMYAEALLDCSRNRKVQKMMATYKFLNAKELL